MSEFCNVEWRPTTAADRLVRCVIPAGVSHETHRSDEGHQMRDLSQPAPPSREAEIAARPLSDKLADCFAEGSHTYLVPMALGIEIDRALRAQSDLLAQLQQARQERDAERTRKVNVGMEASRRIDELEAALQQAREALTQIKAIRDAAHPDGAVGKVAKIYRVADAALHGGGR